MRILLVEDDCAIAQALATTLNYQQHYLVDIATDGQEGWELATAFNYNLIVLDVMLPKLDGMSLCQQLRQHGYQIPILMLTARDSRTDKVMGLDVGADDYVVKPFDFSELVARIRALLRRGSSSLPPVLTWGELRLDPSSCKVTYGGQTLHVTPKEYGLLELFLRNQQRTFSRSEIVDRLWNLEDPPQEDTIKSYIKSLRQKLKAAGASTDLIETVYGLGYRLQPAPLEEPAQDLSMTQEQILLAVAKFREVFLGGISDRLAAIEQAVEASKEGKLSMQLQQKAVLEAHKLAGALGSFGFAESSRLAQQIELLLGDTNCAAQSSRLDKLLKQLQRQIKLTPPSSNCLESLLS